MRERLRGTRLCRTIDAITLLVAFSPLAASAQGVILVRAGTNPRIVVAPGAKQSVAVVADLSNAPGANLAALTTSISWSAGQLQLDSIGVGTFGAIAANTNNAASGSATLSSFAGVGATGTVTLAHLFFTGATRGSTRVSLVPSVAGDQLGVDVLANVRVTDVDVCVGQSGIFGDVTLDNNVNIIDAQQIARFSVGLSILNVTAMNAAADVNGDNNINIIDAQQVARFSVGLSAAVRINTSIGPVDVASVLSISSVLAAAAGGVQSSVPANLSSLSVGSQAQIRPIARDSTNADVTGCVPITYASSNPSVATVSANGLLTAIGFGSTSIAITSGSKTITIAVTVPAGGVVTTNSWTNAAGGLWSQATNWSLGRVPTNSDSAVISQAGTYSVTIDGPAASVPYVTLGGTTGTQTLVITSNTLSVATLSVSGTGALNLSDGTVNGSVNNQGQIAVIGSTNVIKSLAMGAGSGLRIEGNGGCCNAILSVLSGVVNFGTIILSSQNGPANATLQMPAGGSLVNEVSGTISIQQNGGGARRIDAPITNLGTLDVATDFTLTRSTVSSGTITIAAGRSLTGGGSNASFIYTGGTIGGAGTLVVAPSGALTMNADLTTANLNLVATNARIDGSGTLSNAAGRTLPLDNTTIAVPFVNQGTVTAINTGNSLSNTVTTVAGSLVRIQGNGGCCNATLALAHTFVNVGTLELSSQNGPSNATLTFTNGSLVNQVGGTINILSNGGGARVLDGPFQNFGTLSVQADITLTKFAATTGTLDIALGSSLTISPASQFIYSGGTIGGAGTLVVAPGATLTVGAPLATTALNLSLANAIIGGSAPVTNVAGRTLALDNTVINAPFVNQGTVTAIGAGNAINGTFTTDPASVLRIEGNGGCCNATVTFAQLLTNTGTIVMSSQNGPAAATLSSANGVVNVPGAIISILQGGGGARILDAPLTNQGTLDVSANVPLTKATTTTGTIAIAPGQTLTIGASTPFTYGGGTIGGAGTLAVAPTGTLTLGVNLSTTNLNLDLTNATITGTGTLTNVAGRTVALNNTTITTPVVNQGTLTAIGAGNTLTSTVTTVAGSMLRIEGNGGCCNATVTMATTFVNFGTLELSSQNGASNATLTFTNGSLVNEVGGTITILPNGGGARSLNAPFLNLGTLNVQADITLTKGLNTSGTVNIGAGASLTIAPTAPLNYGGGFIGGAGALVVAPAALMSISVALTTASLNLVLTNATLGGSAQFTNVAGKTLALNNTTINTPFANQGIVNVVNTANNINSPLSTAPGSTIRVEGNGGCCNSTLTVASGFVNDGAIVLATQNGGANVTLAVTSGTLQVSASGTLDILGNGGVRQINASINSQGIINIAPGDLYLLTVAGALTSSGTVNVELLSASSFDQITVSGALSLAGTLNVGTLGGFVPQVGQSFTVFNAGSVNGTFGTVNGPGSMTAQYNPTTVVLVP